MTNKNQKIDICKSDKCPCMEDCILMRTMSVIGGKWKIAIICALHTDGTMRYNSLMRKIKGITNTMLAKSLKELEDAGLVARKQYQEMPVRVEYSITDNCKKLTPILGQLAGWGLEVLEPEK